ncbi:unnamed protein product [Tilletia laevis]|uniref:glutamine--fructose-6-phosphate transaminase (isomerizing) n=1 Tax=Tilletia laevis TaxID=157183 RepID=A0A9N8LA42_9BASI|nr:unnamed protein product [Tilletia laevis]
MCGIFGYVNHLVEKDRRQVIEILVNGLQRLEYRGYDSAGIAVDGDNERDTLIFKQVGKVEALRKHISESPVDFSKTFINQCSMAHTRCELGPIVSEVNEGQTIVICNDDDANVAADAKAIRVPSTVDCLQGLLTAVPLQLLSYHLNCAAGVDVDCPRTWLSRLLLSSLSYYDTTFVQSALPNSGPFVFTVLSNVVTVVSTVPAM